MVQRVFVGMGLLMWLLTQGVALAASAPAKIVQQFIEAHRQGRFAESRGFALEQVNLNHSLFSNWLFGSAQGEGGAGTADIFLSRKFAQAFRYSIIGTTPSGDNQVYVSAVRTSPNLTHLYTWALAPKRGTAPYELIGAIDDYLTKVNFPLEESRMQFTLIREADEWYISTIHDEKFQQLQQQFLLQEPLSAAAPLPAPSTPPVTTTTSDDVGRQIADAQFNATLQSFNRGYQPSASPRTPETEKKEKKTSFLRKVGKLFGLGGKKGNAAAKVSDPTLQKTFISIRDALAIYGVSNGGYVPDNTDIYDWKSLRRLVNRYSKKEQLPPTEDAAGFTFISYRTDVGRGDYTLLFELHEPQDGLKRVEVTANGIERAS